MEVGGVGGWRGGWGGWGGWRGGWGGKNPLTNDINLHSFEFLYD